MISEPFDPASPAAWIAHGRNPELAAALAGAWRSFPDLPASAPADARLARMRDRTAALKPVMDAVSRRGEAERQARNFAFTEGQLASGKGDARDRAILRGRDLYGYDWNQAVRYAQGWYAAYAGWEPETRRAGMASHSASAYDQGFADGGGNRDDPFDAARRAFLAAGPPVYPPVLAGRPRPSDWPRPSDAPRPARWSRRLLLLGAPEAGLVTEQDGGPAPSAVLTAMLKACPDHDGLTVIVATGCGFRALAECGVGAGIVEADHAAATTGEHRVTDQLRALVGAGDFDDALVAAQGLYLDQIDAHAAALPLCRTMERTRNTVLQQRAHFRIWLDRGLADGQSMGAGHIRWGKAIKGLTGRLGEFTARYTGKLPKGGHRIAIETAEGRPALGYVTPFGDPLVPEIVITNRAHLRKAMAAGLRAFCGATRLAAPGTIGAV